MEIRGFFWTDHAELRLRQRGLARFEIEEAVREGHKLRRANSGAADWRIRGERSDGSGFAVIYDNPVNGCKGLVRIVSVWALRGNRIS